MSDMDKKKLSATLRKERTRAKISGTAERPRLSVSISNKHVSAQLIDDTASKTLASATSIGKKATGSISEIAAVIGEDIAKKATKLKIKKAVFDRGANRYGKRMSSLADAARKGGLEF